MRTEQLDVTLNVPNVISNADTTHHTQRFKRQRMLISKRVDRKKSVIFLKLVEKMIECVKERKMADFAISIVGIHLLEITKKNC